MQYHAAEQLYVIVHHIPRYFVSACHPVILVYGFVAFDMHEVVSFGGKVAVELGGRNLYFFIFGKTFGCRFYESEDLWQGIVESFLIFVENGFLDFVDLFPHIFAFVVLDAFYVVLDFGDTCFFRGNAFLYLFPYVGNSATQFVVVQRFDFCIFGQNPVDIRLYFAQVALRFVPE